MYILAAFEHDEILPDALLAQPMSPPTPMFAVDAPLVGLTATPKRADGLEKSMFALLGDVVYEVSKEDVSETTCPIKIQTVETNYVPDYNAVLMGDGTLNYAKLVDELINDKDRFQCVSFFISEQ